MSALNHQLHSLSLSFYVRSVNDSSIDHTPSIWNELRFKLYKLLEACRVTQTEGRGSLLKSVLQQRLNQISLQLKAFDLHQCIN